MPPQSPFAAPVDPESYVYHYTTRDTAICRILYSSELRIGPFELTNDPREYKDWEFDLTWSGDLEPPDIEKHASIKRTATTRARSGIKLLCMTSDDRRALERDPLDTFARGFARPRMWAQYAENHLGVCLIFDREVLHQAIDSQAGFHSAIYRGSVRYSDHEAVRSGAFSLDYESIVREGLESTLTEHLHRHHQLLFFCKATDWSAEIEYRWLLSSLTTEPEFIEFGDSLVGVVVGASFQEAYEPSIRGLCAQRGAYFARLYWRNGHPGLITFDS